MKKLKNVLVYFPSIENGGMEKNLFNMLNFISNKNLIKFYLFKNFVNKNIKKKISKKIRIIKYGSSINVLNNRYLISFVSFFYFFLFLKKNFFKKYLSLFCSK